MQTHLFSPCSNHSFLTQGQSPHAPNVRCKRSLASRRPNPYGLRAMEHMSFARSDNGEIQIACPSEIKLEETGSYCKQMKTNTCQCTYIHVIIYTYVCMDSYCTQCVFFRLSVRPSSLYLSACLSARAQAHHTLTCLTTWARLDGLIDPPCFKSVLPHAKSSLRSKVDSTPQKESTSGKNALACCQALGAGSAFPTISIAQVHPNQHMCLAEPRTLRRQIQS